MVAGDLLTGVLLCLGEEELLLLLQRLLHGRQLPCREAPLCLAPRNEVALERRHETLWFVPGKGL